MINKKSYIVDENKYSIGWRFNAGDCSLADEEKEKIIFLDAIESERLWQHYFLFNNLMQINESHFNLTEKYKFDFGNQESINLFLSQKLQGISVIFYFCGKKNAAIVPKDIFLKAWDDFFYPSDENTIILIPNKNSAIYSFEETFFYGYLISF